MLRSSHLCSATRLAWAPHLGGDLLAVVGRQVGERHAQRAQHGHGARRGRVGRRANVVLQLVQVRLGRVARDAALAAERAQRLPVCDSVLGLGLGLLRPALKCLFKSSLHDRTFIAMLKGTRALCRQNSSHYARTHIADDRRRNTTLSEIMLSPATRAARVAGAGIPLDTDARSLVLHLRK